MSEMEENAKTNRGTTVDVLPLGKWKRILLFLGDFFIVFIAAIFLSNIAVYPIIKSTTGYDVKESNDVSHQQDRFQILYDNELLFYESAETKNNIEENLSYTFDRFLSYYVVEGPVGDEIFHTYYSSYPNKDNQTLIELYERYDNLHMFDFESLDSNGLPALKVEFKEQLAPYFDPKDEMSETGKRYYDDIFPHFFLSMFYTMIDDVKANDLVSPDGTPSRSYDELTSLIDGFDQYKQNMAIIASSVSFSIACILIYFVYPQVNKTGRTPSQSMLRVDRVDKSSFTIMKRWVRVLIGIYQSVFSIPMLLFLPIPTVSVNYVFSIAPLFGLFITGAVLLIADMIVVLADKYNRGLTELFTHSVCLKEESLDEIYKAKGHYL